MQRCKRKQVGDDVDTRAKVSAFSIKVYGFLALGFASLTTLHGRPWHRVNCQSYVWDIRCWLRLFYNVFTVFAKLLELIVIILGNLTREEIYLNSSRKPFTKEDFLRFPIFRYKVPTANFPKFKIWKSQIYTLFVIILFNFVCRLYQCSKTNPIAKHVTFNHRFFNESESYFP